MTVQCHESSDSDMHMVILACTLSKNHNDSHIINMTCTYVYISLEKWIVILTQVLCFLGCKHVLGCWHHSLCGVSKAIVVYSWMFLIFTLSTTHPSDPTLVFSILIQVAPSTSWWMECHLDVNTKYKRGVCVKMGGWDEYQEHSWMNLPWPTQRVMTTP